MWSTSSDYVQELQAFFAQQANPQDAVFMRRYLKDQFDFFGIKTPLRRALSAQYMADAGIPDREELQLVCRLCFQAPQREIQYFVNDVLQQSIRRLDGSFLSLVDELIGVKSWWDTVDFLAPKLAGALFLRFPDQIRPFTKHWIDSDNCWYQRAAIIFQLGYKKRTDAALLFDYIRRRADSREFFVQKGAGWALRQYSRTDPEAVVQFVADAKLPTLTRREALKWLRAQGRLTPDDQLRK